MSEISIQTPLLHRVSPVSLKDIHLLSSESLALFWEELSQTEKAFKEHCEKFTNLLFDKIQLCPDTKDRNKLLNTKRTIHNKKPLKSKEERILNHYLKEEEKEWLTSYQKSLATLNDFVENGENIFEEALFKTRKHFKSLIKENEPLKQSLQLSSQSLYAQLHEYLNTDTKSLKKTLAQAEIALLKYLTRQYTKTSPFSRFTCLSTGEEVEKTSKIRAKARVNNYLLPYLKGLLLQVPTIARNISIKLNPSITQQETGYSYLVNFNNVEVFQHINKTDGLDLIISSIDSHLSIAELANQLSVAFDGVSNSDIEAYLFQLMDIGFIESNIHVSGTDPDWLDKFSHFLASISDKNSALEKLRQSLYQVQEATFEFSKADTNQRQQLLDDTFDVLKEAIRSFCAHNQLPFSEGEANEAAKKQYLDIIDQDTSFRIRYFNGFTFSKENIFYEDAALSETAPYTASDLQPLVEKLETLYRSFGVFSELNQHEQKSQNYFFKNFYPGKNKVPLLQFYEDYYREFLKPNKEGKKHFLSGYLQHESQHNSKKLQALKNSFYELLRYKSFSHHEVNFTEEELTNTFGKGTKKDSSYSKGCFLQLFKGENKETNAVLNGAFTGFGRGYGRFLHLFPESTTEKIKKMNHHFFTNYIKAEVKDASCFNANIHPPLLGHEIIIPGGNTNLPEENQLRVSDLAVQIAKDEICLIHEPSGKSVLPFDLCLQAAYSRSELYQLLVSFSSSQAFMGHLLQNWLYEYIESEQIDEVITFPRITFEENLTLYRKCWKVPVDLLPDNNPNITDFEYWSQLETWLAKHRIPKYCFVFIAHSQQSKNQKASYDDYKPQYMDFSSPLLIRLFRKAVRKATHAIRLEEMLPGNENMMGSSVRETLVEWSVSEKSRIKLNKKTATAFSINE